MLTIQVPEIELFNQATQEFTYIKATTLKFENSLVSISKWEQKWKIPFPAYQSKKILEINEYIKFTEESFASYLSFMCITQNVDPNIFNNLPYEKLIEIKKYIEDPMTATIIGNAGVSNAKDRIITNEMVYFWMTSYQIPFEAAKWHINHLLTLINVASIENAPKKKMTAEETAKKYQAINKARRAQAKARAHK